MEYIFNKNKLKELLKSKTAFILGAGASSDYGFPLWHELKTKIENNLQNLPPLSDISHHDVKFWRKEINNAENKTIDDLLFEHDKRSSDYIL